MKGLLVDTESEDSEIEELRGKGAYGGIAQLIQVSQRNDSTKRDTERQRSGIDSLLNRRPNNSQRELRLSKSVKKKQRIKKILNFGNLMALHNKDDKAKKISNSDELGVGGFNGDEEFEEKSVTESQGDMVPNFGRGDILWDRLMIDFKNVVSENDIGGIDSISFEEV